MTRTPGLTIVIPTYNRAELLDRCVGSALHDVVDRRDLRTRVRVVVADDRSDSEAALRMLDALGSRYSSDLLKIVRLPRNTGGASMPRNTALDHVETSHVFFVDSDDYLGAGSAERLLDILDRRPELDYLAVNTVSDSERVRELTVTEEFKPVDFPDAAGSLSCKRIYRFERLRDLGLRFDESMTVFEDCLFTFSYLAHAADMAVAGGHDYYHFSGHSSVGPVEDGHLSRRDHTRGYFAHHRVADMLRFLEGALLELAAADVSDQVRTTVAVDVLLPRFFRIMGFRRFLGFVSNKDRQRGLFRRARILFGSSLYTKEYVLAGLESAHGRDLEAIFADDLERFLA
ncbi:glycosyltransferase family 2 protein [Nocardioides panzhihuensis]|uniref:Glycosyltransferase involved in cell wall biosynthesis n=1 Tax=Nocardioides panzhihuensis TaxID=860243 RepID=A0A7Z0DIP7_9ACTN|nr:glycosyltransferase family A protein [Nocardioides panzhihuensis]NYI76316.1 glycosyltransferase involved in cell wall biosynthesis [Nocardioides panzhihuensis]